MENEREEKNTEKRFPVNYEEKIEPQQELVKKLAAEFEKNPSENVQLEFARETDRLRYFTNAAKGNPKERAQKAAEFAKSVTINKAIQQIPAPGEADQ